MGEPPVTDRGKGNRIQDNCRCGFRIVAIKIQADDGRLYAHYRAVDSMGIVAQGDQIYGCPKCGLRFPATWSAFLEEMGRAWGP